MIGETAIPFPAPAEAACLYVGEVMHARLKPKPHRFVYKVFSLLIDLDALAKANRASRLFSVGRFNLLSFFERDHGPGDGSPLGAHIRALLARDGIDLSDGRILLLCYPRFLGYVFNPLATYWCYGADGALKAVVYEVTNTFKERHAYVASVKEGELSAAGLRQSRDKLMYVSPFIDMSMTYDFRMRPPGDGVRLRILESDADGPLLSATFSGERRPLVAARILGLFARMPLMTLKVIAAIHFEAARLWLKGVRLADHPPAPANQASYDAPGSIRHGRSAPTRSAETLSRSPKTVAQP